MTWRSIVDPLVLTPTQRRIMDIIEDGLPEFPVSSVEVEGALYADREDGGAISNPVVSQVCYMRKRLKGTRIKIASRFGPCGGYWLEIINEVRNAA